MEKKAKLCYMGTDSFIAYIQMGDILQNMLKQDSLLQNTN